MPVAPPRPNVVLVLTDDLGWADFSSMGERHDLANRRLDVAWRLRPLLDEWERDVDAEAKPTSATAKGGER